MTELCLPSNSTTSTRAQFYSLVMSKLLYLCRFILTHPLYFCYLVFFSPYLVKLFSFLSPLFITTTLLLLTLFTISPTLILPNNSELPDSRNVTHLLLSAAEKFTQDNHEIDELVEFEAYKLVFGSSVIDVQENSVEFLECISAEESETPVLDSSCHDEVIDNLEENSAELVSYTKHAMEEKKLESFFKELDEFEKKKEAPSNIINVHSQGLGQNLDYLGNSYGSIRKEKEWNRTLACKLFEERHNGSYSNSEGMDLLWEKYEVDTKKNKVKRESSTNSSRKMKKRGDMIKGYEDEDDEEMDDEQQLCCLQALKFSSKKMNLGLGRPNLVKISKALRGFGWLHHVSKNKKKVHCGDGF